MRGVVLTLVGVAFSVNASTAKAEQESLLTFASAMDGEGLKRAAAVSVAPDGRHLYVAGGPQISWFARDELTGEVSYVDSVENKVDGPKTFIDPQRIVMSADGLSLYAVSNQYMTATSSLVHFRRDPVEGTLTFVQEFGRSLSGGDDHLAHMDDLVIAPDGEALYVRTENYGRILVFDRNAESGHLSLIQETQETGIGGSIEVSPDGRHLYNSAPHTVRYERNATTGRLDSPRFLFEPSTEYPKADLEFVGNRDLYGPMPQFRLLTRYERNVSTGLIDRTDQAPDQRFVGNTARVVATDDGLQLFAISSDADALFGLTRDPESGRVGFGDEENDRDPLVTGLNAVSDVAVAADSTDVYTVSPVDSSLVHFKRNPSIDAVPPTTLVVSHPKVVTPNAVAEFEFASDDPDARYECSLDAGVYLPCSAKTSFGPLPDGPHYVRVRAIDEAGNIDPTPELEGWRTDTEVPETTIYGPGRNQAGNLQFDLSVSEGGGTKSYCRIDSGDWEACNGGSSHEAPFLADGTYTFYARSVDEAGNVENPPAAKQFVVDRTPPEVLINGPRLTSDERPTFSWTGEAAATHRCAFDPVESDDYEACEPNGSAKPDEALSEGGHSFEITAVDPGGNRIDFVYSFRVDRTPPDTELVRTPEAMTRMESISFEYRAISSQPAVLECRLDQDEFSVCHPKRRTFRDLAEGRHEFAARALDEAGNADESPALFEFVVDRTAPEVTITKAPRETTRRRQALIEFSALDADRLYCRLDSGPEEDCSERYVAVGLARGKHEFSVRAEDEAKNVGPSATVRWKVKRRRGS